jgi:hypothetical protein
MMPVLLDTAKDADDTVRAVALDALVKIVRATGRGVAPFLDQLAAVQDDVLLDALARDVDSLLSFQCAKRCIARPDSHAQGVRLMARVLDANRDSNQVSLVPLLADAAVGLLTHAEPGRDAEEASVLVQMALLLSERELDQVVTRLVAVPDRPASCALMVLQLTKRFGSLFVPIFPFEAVVDWLRSGAAAGEHAEDDEQQQRPLATRGKRAKRTAPAPQASLPVRVERALLCLAEFCVHAAGAGLEKAKFSSALGSLLAVLRQVPNDLGGMVAKRVVAPAFTGLALASSRADWQTLHHALTKETRSGETRVRRAAVAVILALFERVGQDYLALMPDTLPFLSELLEDTDEQVRESSQALVKVLRELSGEDVTKFLR